VETVIKTEGLSKVYKSTFGGRHVHALQGLDLDIKRGETYGLVGPNGSGKTTTIKILVGLIYSSSGSATLFGSSLSDPAV
jgi:ABC-2 type transport system ATP-binding protein